MCVVVVTGCGQRVDFIRDSRRRMIVSNIVLVTVMTHVGGMALRVLQRVTNAHDCRRGGIQ